MIIVSKKFNNGGQLIINEFDNTKFKTKELGEYSYLDNFRSLDDIQQSLAAPQSAQLPQTSSYNITPPKKPIENYKLGSGKKDYSSYQKYVGYNEFSRAFDEVEQEMPEASQYRELLTKIAEHESGFNKKVKNKAGSPAYGYFQFMEQKGKWDNITKYAGTDIETFRKDPKLQIKAAIKLAQAFQNRFNQTDLNKAQQQGITISGLIGGAWLAGVGGVRNYLNGKGDASDAHWSKEGKGDKVSKCLIRYNDL